MMEKNPVPNTSLNSSETANSTPVIPHIQIFLFKSPSSTTNHETSPSSTTNHETETSPSSKASSSTIMNHETETSPSSKASSSTITNHETETSSSSTVNHETETISDVIDELFEANVIPDIDILPDEGINLLNLLEEVAFDYEDFNFITDTKGF